MLVIASCLTSLTGGYTTCVHQRSADHHRGEHGTSVQLGCEEETRTRSTRQIDRYPRPPHYPCPRSHLNLRSCCLLYDDFVCFLHISQVYLYNRFYNLIYAPSILLLQFRNGYK